MGALQISERPTKLNDVIGNKSTIESIKGILNRDDKDIPQAWLFQGPPGCGKTTLARIVKEMLEIKDLNFHEYNSASMRGIDTIRDISRNATASPLGGGKQAYLIDECFHPDTLIDTPNGKVKIKDIQIGDKVLNIFGTDTVVSTKKNKISLDRLCLVTLSNGKEIFTTIDHKFFTSKGWVAAKNLENASCVCYVNSCERNHELNNEGFYAKEKRKEMDTPMCVMWENFQKCCLERQILSKVFDKNMSMLREKISGTKNKKKNLQRMPETGYTVQNSMFDMWRNFQKCCSKCQILSKLSDFNLQILWEKIYRQTSKSPVLFKQLFNERQNEQTRDEGESLFQRGQNKSSEKQKSFFDGNKRRGNPSKTIQPKNEKEQPIFQQRNNRKDKKDQATKWYFGFFRNTWRQWYWFNQIPRGGFELAWEGVDTRIFNENSGAYKRKEKKSLLSKIQNSTSLQDRYSSYQKENCNRTRRIFASNEGEKRIGSEERQDPKTVRVESVTLYEQANFQTTLKNKVTDEERRKGFVEFYDLQVHNHPSYKAEGVIVHNCHQITGPAQEALLKTLEDVPPNTWFFLATTNPEKLRPAIKSRCTLISVDRVGTKDLKKLINRTLKSLGLKEIPKTVEKQIIKNANGACRDAIKLLDTIIDIKNEDDMLNAVNSAYVDETTVKDIWTILLGKGKPAQKWKELAKVLKNISGEPEQMRYALLTVLSRNLLDTGSVKTAGMIEAFENNYYDSGHAGLILSCFNACFIE